MATQPHVRVDDETHETLHLMRVVTKQSYPEMVATLLASHLAANPKLAAKIEGMRKAAAA